MSDQEEWRPVVGFEGLYEVSNLGRVRSLDRVVEVSGRWGPVERRHYKGRVISASIMGSAKYLGVGLARNGKVRTIPVHKLVAEAFHGPCPEGMECRHMDCNSLNNKAENLCWGTRRENREDSRRNGTLAVGERIAQHKLTEDDVIRVKGSKKPNSKLSEEFGVSERHIRKIKNGELWKHV